MLKVKHNKVKIKQQFFFIIIFKNLTLLIPEDLVSEDQGEVNTTVKKHRRCVQVN